MNIEDIKKELEGRKYLGKVVYNGKGVAGLPQGDKKYHGICLMMPLPCLDGTTYQEYGRVALIPDLDQKSYELWQDTGYPGRKPKIFARCVAGNDPLDPSKLDETEIEYAFGEMEAEAVFGYDAWDGCAIEEEKLLIGDFDLIRWLDHNVGSGYCHLEFDVYSGDGR